MKTSILRVTGSVASIASCLVLFGGVASAQSISDTGSRSDNRIDIRNVCKVNVDNNTDIDIDSDVDQDADSGNVTVNDNTTVGNVSSGEASNTSTVSFGVNVENTTAGCFSEIEEESEEVNGGGRGAGDSVVTPAGTTTTTQVGGGAGGLGAGNVAAGFVEAQQVAAPVGGVGAGTGGVEYLSGLVAVTLLSGTLAARRLYRPFKSSL